MGPLTTTPSDDRKSQSDIAGPLRTIVSQKYVEGGYTVNLLDCGHTQLATRDSTGGISEVADTQRCRQCKKATEK
jgi:hypothetical protein